MKKTPPKKSRGRENQRIPYSWILSPSYRDRNDLSKVGLGGVMTEKVADLSVDELKAIIHEIVENTLKGLLVDPDESMDLHPDFRDEVLSSIEEMKKGSTRKSFDEVADTFGFSNLNDDR